MQLSNQLILSVGLCIPNHAHQLYKNKIGIDVPGGSNEYDTTAAGTASSS